MRRIASAAAVMAMTAVLLPIPATLSPALAEPENGESAEPLVVERLTPDVVGEDSTVRVSGEVANTTSEPVEDVTVRVRYSRHPFSSRDELDDFASGTGWQPDAEGPDTDAATALAPGDGAQYSLALDVEELELGSYGVYPLVVEALDGDGDSMGAQYTFLPYTGGDDDVPSVGIAWVWPLMAPPQRADDDTFLGDSLPSAVGADGRLGRLLSAGAQAPLSFEAGDEDLAEVLGLNEPPEESPGEDATDEETAEALPTDEATEGGNAEDGEDGEDEGDGEEEGPTRTEGVPVTWAVDPGTVDDILRLASADHVVLEDPLAASGEGDPVRTDREVDAAAQVWLREARRVLAADTVVATPYASPDMAALLREGMGSDAEAALRIGQEAVLAGLDLEADDTFALPPGGLMNNDVHGLFAAHGANRFLLDEAAVPPASWLATTPTAQAPLPAQEGTDEETFALVADEGLGEVLSMPSKEPGESALALQRFAAETAMIAGENAGGDRVVVAQPGPGWDPGAEYASGVLSATEGLPWLEPERLDGIELPDASEREDTRGNLTYPDSGRSNELTAAYLGQVDDVNRDVRLFNSILVDDSDPFRPALLRLESVYWREEEALAGAARSLTLESVQDRMDDVRVIAGEPVTLASRTGITGVVVANDLDQAAYVHLSLYSENSERLSIGEYTGDFEIAPGAKTTVYVPLSARINGRTVLHVSLQNADGEPISSQDTEIPVNATGLGTQALLISGIGLLILIAALAPRALRKWARKQSARATNGKAAGDDDEDSSGDSDGHGGDGDGDGGDTSSGPTK